MKAFLLPALLFPLLALAAVDKNEIADKRKACLLRASATKEMKDCEYRAYRAATAELNQVHARMLRELKTSSLDGHKEIEKRLLESHKSWVGLRDSHCHFKSSEMLNGSEESLLLASCTVNMTMDRIKDLKSTKL